MVTGDSQEEVLIFRYTQTDRHFIIIYISTPRTAKSKSQNQKNIKIFVLSSDGIAGLLGGETTTTAAPPTDEEK